MMTDPERMEKDLNGYGGRLRDTELEQARHGEQIVGIKEGINFIDARTIRMEKKIDTISWKVLGLVAFVMGTFELIDRFLK